MQYMVTGHDGKEYGPTDLSTLKQWVAENRLAPTTMLRDLISGQTLPASTVPELFGAAAPPVGAAYPRAGTTYSSTPGVSRDHGSGALIGVIARSALAIVMFFVFHGIGLLIAGYAMFYAVRCLQSGSKYGIAAVAIAGVSLAIIGIGWAMRMSGAHV